MRKLIWFALGFGSAAICSAYLFSDTWLYFLGFACLISGIFLYLRVEKLYIRKLSLFLCGVAVGLAWFQGYDDIYLEPARQFDHTCQSVSVRCTDYGYSTDNGLAVDGKIIIANRNYKIRLYISDAQQIEPGAVIHGSFQFRFTSPGGSREPTYHRGHGIFLTAYPKDEITVVQPNDSNARYFAAYLRHSLLGMIDDIFPSDVSPFARALLLGDTTKLDYATETHLSLSGIRHVAAVSGLHVSILFSFVYFISGKRRYLSAIIGIPCLFIFAALAGFSASVVRACIMQGLVLIALALNREYDSSSALSLAAVIMLLVNPQSITAVGFQLSVASVAGILLFCPKLYAYFTSIKLLSSLNNKSLLSRFVRFVAASVSVSLSAQVFTIPLSALYFGTVSLVCIATNLLCLWAVTILFCGILIACILGFLYLPIGGLVGAVFAWVARYVLQVSALLSQIPGCAVYTESIYIIAWIVFCYILLTVYILMSHRKPLVFAFCIVISLCVALLLSWFEPIFDNYRMSVLDVGQGQCILLQSGGRNYMVDCGGDDDEKTADKAVAVLNSQGVYRLDGLIITHMDRDHAGGVKYLLQRMNVETLIVPECIEASEYATLEGLHKGVLIRATDNVDIKWDDTSIRIFPSVNSESGNESSLCVLFHHEKCDILTTGDRSKAGELELLRNNQLPDLDVLVVGHHGSKNSTGKILLELLKPETAIISVSEFNSYGHPTPEVIQRLLDAGCVIYRTDLNGTITIRG